VIDSFLLGTAAQSALVLCGLVVYVITVPSKVNGAIAGFGSGALIGAISFDLIPESKPLADFLDLAVWLLIGGLVYLVSDRLVEAKFGQSAEKTKSGAKSGGSPLGIVVGAVVDGVPESLIFGIQLATGLAISAGFLAAVWVSNIPQALAPSSELAKEGWRRTRMTVMWGTVVIACGVVASIGYALTDAIGLNGGRAAAFAAGGLLAMLTDSLVPYAYERGGGWAGVWTVVGFAVGMGST
jgi:ZIP family zinc transporter